MKAITPLGKKWEWLRSIWLIWILPPFGLTAYISFFYIAARTKRLKWLIAGLIYLFNIVQVFIFTELFPEDHLVYDLSIGLMIFGWVAVCVHAFLARMEYLQIIAHREQPNKIPNYQRPIPDSENIPTRSTIQDSKNSEEAANQTGKKQLLKNNERDIVKSNTKSFVVSEIQEKININKAKEEELKQIPSIGPFMAQKIILVRKRVGQFTSYEHFVKAMNIKPHILDEARPYLIFNEWETTRKQSSNKDESGRIVDF